MLIPVNSVVIGERYRSVLGDLSALKLSIEDLGQLQPIGVTPKMELVWGCRRLHSFLELGYEQIEAVVVEDYDAAMLLRAEQDENTCREPYIPSDAVRIGKAVEKAERLKAEERMKAGKRPGGKFPQGNGTTGKTRDLVAATVGMSGKTYEKAKAVVEAAEDDSLPAEVQDVAKAAVAEMDTTGKVDPAYRLVQAAKDEQVQAIEQPAASKDEPEEDQTPDQQADNERHERRRKQNYAKSKANAAAFDLQKRIWKCQEAGCTRAYFGLLAKEMRRLADLVDQLADGKDSDDQPYDVIDDVMALRHFRDVLEPKWKADTDKAVIRRTFAQLSKEV